MKGRPKLELKRPIFSSFHGAGARGIGKSRVLQHGQYSRGNVRLPKQPYHTYARTHVTQLAAQVHQYKVNRLCAALCFQRVRVIDEYRKNNINREAVGHIAGMRARCN